MTGRVAPSIAERLAGQLAFPRGLAGSLLGWAMDFANRAPTRMALDLLRPRASERVLDAGCGTGAALAGVLQRAECHCTGIDPSPTMIAAAHAHLGRAVNLVVAAAEDPIAAPGPFDAVLALNVLYFAPHDGAMTRALYRRLRPGGRLVAYVTDRNTMDRWRFARAGRHRLYDATELRDELQAGGFAPAAVSIHERPVAKGVVGLFAVARK